MTTTITKTDTNAIPAIKKVTTASELAQIFDQIATGFKVRGGKKIGLTELALAGQKADKAIDAIREIFKNGELAVVKNIWDITKVDLKYKLAFIDDIELDMELVKHLELRGDFIAKGFMSFHNLEKVEITPYSKHINHFDSDVANRLHELILTLPIEYAKECIMKLEG